jgi:CRP-like cAMP-binding protein
MAFAGQPFGLDCLLGDGRRGSSAVARQDSLAYYIPSREFKETLCNHVHLFWRAFLLLTGTLNRLSRDRLLLSGCRVHEKIENLTRLCAEQPGAASLTPMELAAWLGISEETVCRELRAHKGAQNERGTETKAGASSSVQGQSMSQ